MVILLSVCICRRSSGRGRSRLGSEIGKAVRWCVIASLFVLGIRGPELTSDGNW
jgi:hypothetical protein